MFKYYGIGLIVTFILFGMYITESKTSENKPKPIQTDNSAKTEKNTPSQTMTVRNTKDDSLADIAYYDKTFEDEKIYKKINIFCLEAKGCRLYNRDVNIQLFAAGL